MQPAYSHLVGDMDQNDFQVAKKVTTDTFFLGTSPIISEEQISYIGDVVDSFFEIRK
jgi:dTDP-4-amino-4,6-dideoxygalactose transaminase